MINALCQKDRFFSINNNKGSTVCLESELKSYETNGRFNNLTSYDNIKDEKQEYQTQIVAPIKPGDCIIM